MWFDPPCGQIHTFPHCNAITHEAHSAIPVLTVGCVAQPVGLLLDASALPDLALAYYSAPAARVRQVQRNAPPWRWASSSPNAPNYARSSSRRYVAIIFKILAASGQTSAATRQDSTLS